MQLNPSQTLITRLLHPRAIALLLLATITVISNSLTFDSPALAQSQPQTSQPAATENTQKSTEKSGVSTTSVTGMPRIVFADMMTWSTPYSPRFRKGGRAPKATDGGYFNNAPLIPELVEDQLRSSEGGGDIGITRFKDAAASGIDVVCIDYFDNTPLDLLFRAANTAQRSNTGVKVCLFIDVMPKDGPGILRKIWEWPELRDHPSLLRIDNKPVVMSYSVNHLDTLRAALEQAKSVGGNFYVIADACGSSTMRITPHVPAEELREPLALADALYYFGNFSLALGDEGILPEFKRFAQSYQPPKKFAGTIRPGYQGMSRVGCMIPCAGTQVLRKQWLEIIRYQPDFVTLSTLNDYGEASEQECSANSTFALIDLNAYFGQRWKTGSFPALDQPRAFLSYRQGVVLGENPTFELVLLRPELSGSESAEQIASSLKAQCQVRLNERETITLESAGPEVFPGHVVWNFSWKKGFKTSGFAIPSVTIFDRKQKLVLPEGACPAMSVLRDTQELPRKWLHVPLHRLRGSKEATVQVSGSPGNLYPRTIRLTGLAWDQVAGGHIILNGNPLSATITPEMLRDGFVELPYDGPGWGPMAYNDGWIKRNLIDSVDSYSAVVRLKDDTFVYFKPVLVPAPSQDLDPSTAVDYLIAPMGKSNVLLDRGPMRRHLDLESAAANSRPVVSQDAATKPWFLHFDGLASSLRIPAPSMPAGPVTVELWLRPLSLGKPQAVFNSIEDVLSIDLSPQTDNITAGGLIEKYARGYMGDRKPVVIPEAGRVIVSRLDANRNAMQLVSTQSLKVGQWHHVVAVFTGATMSLYIDGNLAAGPVEIQGLRQDEQASFLGSWPWASKNKLHADVARFRILQRAMTGEQVRAVYEKQRGGFSP